MTTMPGLMQKLIKILMPYVYTRPYVYSVWQIFQALRLFPTLRLFQTLEYKAKGHTVHKCVGIIRMQVLFEAPYMRKYGIHTCVYTLSSLTHKCCHEKKCFI